MPFDLYNPSTWITSTLDTPAGQIPFWQLSDFDGYDEKNERDGNLVSTLIAVAWNDRVTWKKYALGTVRKLSSTYLERFTPMQWPSADKEDLYLISVSKMRMHVGINSQKKPLFAVPEGTRNNFFGLNNGVFPARIIYRCVFGNYPFKIVDQTTFIRSEEHTV